MSGKYDPDSTATWTTRQLLEYCTQHGLEPEQGMEKSELLKMVDVHVTDTLLRSHLKEQLALNEAEVDNILLTPASELLKHVAYPKYAEILRKHPEKLQEIIEAGIAQLSSTKFAVDMRDVERHPPIEAWISCVSRGTDSGRVLVEALTASANTAVCGKFFNDSDMVVRCLECGADGTCVMCMDCFQRSPCTQHNYRINRGSGGGMCDCGDPTAWKPESFCSLHGGHKKDADPIASTIPAEHREWVCAVLRGCVRLVAMTMRQSMQMDALILKTKESAGKKKATSNKKRKGGQGGPSGGGEEGDFVILEAANPNWIGDWLLPVAKEMKLFGGCSDAAKRIFADAWTEVAPAIAMSNASTAASLASSLQCASPTTTTRTDSSCLEVVFQYAIRRKKTAGEWWSTTLDSIGLCLSDPTFRIPFSALYATYAERIVGVRSIQHFDVQVLTNPEAVEDCMTPSRLPYKAAHDTIVHRLISSILYALDELRENPSDSQEDKNNASAQDSLKGVSGADWMFYINEHTNVTGSVYSELNMALSCCRVANYTTVLSRVCFRGLLSMLHLISVSTAVHKVGTGSDSKRQVSRWLASVVVRIIWSVHKASREVTSHLLDWAAQAHGTEEEEEQVAGDGPTSSKSSSLTVQQLADVLHVPLDILRALEKSFQFDAVPDIKARRAGHTAITQHCALSKGETALTLPCQGYERYAVNSIGSRREQAGLEFCTSLLHEILHEMRLFFHIQRVKFCKNNGTVVLARRDGFMQGKTLLPLIYQYELLEPCAHATTTVNHLQHLFASIVKTWMMELKTRKAKSKKHHEIASTGGLSASAASAAAAASLVRLYGKDNVSPSEGSSTLAVSSPSTAVAAMASTGSGADPLTLHALVRNVLTSQAGNQEAHQLVEQLMDSLLMPFVLLSQVHRGFWRRDEFNVNEGIIRYTMLDTKIGMENDVLLLQVLTMCMPAEDYALRVLERFSYQPPFSSSATTETGEEEEEARAANQDAARAHSTHTTITTPELEKQQQQHRRRCCVAGYGHMLRLLLTIITDTSKANRYTEFGTEAITRTTANVLCRKRMLFSTLSSYVSSNARGEYAEDDDDEEKLSSKLHSILAMIGVSEQTEKGKQFRIKDSATWAAHVDLYHPIMADMNLDDMHTLYRSTVLLERLQEGAVAERKDEVICLPRTTFRTKSEFAELVPHTRALLHTDAILLPAIYVVLTYVNNLKRDKPKQQSDGKGVETAADAAGRHASVSVGSTASDNEEDDDSSIDIHALVEAPKVGEHLLLHAITALYLSVRDCADVCQALKHEAGVAGGDAGDATTVAVEGTATVEWERVEEYVNDTIKCQGTFASSSAALILPLPSLAGAGSVRTMLMKPVVPRELHMHDGKHAAAGASAVSTVEMLHTLRDYLRANKSVDKFGLTTMLEYVLLTTGLATFAAEGLSSAEAALAEEAKNRQQRLKEKQAKLMQRMRNRATAATATTTEAAGQEGKSKDGGGSGATLTSADSGFVHTQLLLEVAALECCVCRVSSEEPLMLLGHCASSNVLKRLDAIYLPDKRPVNCHLSVCGHVAHKSCTEKVFARLAQLWRRGYFQGQAYLGPTEFACPMCTMICNAVLPVPVLGAAAGNAGARGADVTLFQEICQSSVDEKSPFFTSQCSGIKDSLTVLAQASIGLSISHDASSIAPYEDDLQRSNNDAWELSEAVRGVHHQLETLLQAAKIGRVVINKDLLGLMSLLIAVRPVELRKHEAALRANFTRTQEALCILMVDCLLSPREAARSIATHVARLMTQSESVKAVIKDLLCEAAAEATDVAQNAGSEEEEEKESETVKASCVRMALWQELGCLTLLKTLVTEESASCVLGSSQDGSSEAVVVLTPFAEGLLATRHGRCTALMRMWQYLALGSSATPLPEVVTQLQALWEKSFSEAAAAPVVFPTQSCHLLHYADPAKERSLPAMPVLFTSSQQWARHILANFIHLPESYTAVLSACSKAKVCSECGARSTKPVLCNTCGKFLCLQQPQGGPELYKHARSCSAGIGLFQNVRHTSLMVVDGVTGRVCTFRSIYTDSFGETDESLMRGVPLTRDAHAAMHLLLCWMLSEWGVDSRILKHSWRGNVELM